MTYAKSWTGDAQEDLKMLAEVVRREVIKTSVLVAAHPHMGSSRYDEETGLRMVLVEGTHLEMHYQPDVPAKVVTIVAVSPVDGAPGDPYGYLV